MEDTNPEALLDLLIVGGGPAGMSAALVAGRAMLSTVIVNAETPRNAVTTASHGFLTRDGAHPTELLAVAKGQLRKYGTVRYLAETVEAVRKLGGGFEVELVDGARFMTRRIVIATGYRDDLSRLELPGIEQVYGKSVYPCIFCDGFEHRGERLAIFGREDADHYAPKVRLWSDDVIVFTNGTPLPPDAKAELELRNVRVLEHPIRRLVSENGRLRAVELSTGDRIERDAGFIAEDYSLAATTFAEDLGVATSRNEWGMEALSADDFGKTAVPGVYVVGDAKVGFGGLIWSASEGAGCAESIVGEIAAEHWATANVSATYTDRRS